MENFGFENYTLFLRKRQLAKFTCKSVRCKINTSPTIAEASLNLSLNLSSLLLTSRFWLLSLPLVLKNGYGPWFLLEKFHPAVLP